MTSDPRVVSRLDTLATGQVAADLDATAGRFTLLAVGEPIALSDVLPVLHSLGFVVLDERPDTLATSRGESAWVYEFGVRVDPPLADDRADLVVDAFQAVWTGLAEIDPFNLLVPRVGLTWREAALLRAYARFLKLVGLPFAPAQIVRVLERHAEVTRLMVDLFGLLLDPDRADATDAALVERLARSAIETVAGIDDDRILRAFLSLVLATMRTDFYLVGRDGPSRLITLKLDSRSIPEVPEPRPHFEVFVYGRDVEGAHLRYSRVARGGLRWSDRTDDYRTEVLGLVRAQMVKNAIIVPAGAKGVFIAKHGEGVDCYRSFISALLGVTDNLDVTTGAVVPPERVVRRDGDDPYLVVAADRGTATFSDLANELAQERGFWLGDAFASGGSVGYDHKALGITALGAWESARRHFRELGLDADHDPLSVAGIGDMSGDVFGNGMLISPSIRLVAAFDHRHVFLDPAPDPAASHAERARLFALPRSSWADYDPALISAGGGVWPRTDKTIPISDEVARVLDLPEGTRSLPSRDVIRAILRAPVDLLWNGGIGTYVKAAAESQLDAGDKSNDAVRVNAGEVRARVVIEGGNLGLSARARVEFAQAGGAVNSDAWDNSAGVDCSDHEVNIKVLLNAAVAEGTLSGSERDSLLAEMTADVTALVLAENRAQNELLGTTRSQAADLLGIQGRLIAHLEARGALNRTLESLPGDDEIQRRADQGGGLTSPELATLAAHVKLTIKSDLLLSDALDGSQFTSRLLAYFPVALQRRFSAEILQHPLRREILATILTNELVDRGGVAFAFRIAEATGASTADIVRSYIAAHDIFDVPHLLDKARGADSIAVSDLLVREIRRLLERGTRWLLAQRPQPVDVVAETERYREAILTRGPSVAHLLAGPDAEIVAGRADELVELGAGAAEAHEAMTLLHRFCMLDVVDIALLTGIRVEEAATLYYLLNAHLEVDHLLSAVSALPQRGRWDSQARLLLRSDIYRSVRALCVDVLSAGGDPQRPEELISAWEEANSSRIARARGILVETAGVAPATWTTLSVAVRQLASMASGTTVPVTAGGVHQPRVGA